MPGQSRPGSNCNEGVFHIQDWSLTIGWFNVILPGHLFRRLIYPSVGMQLLYRKTPADWSEVFFSFLMQSSD